MPQLDVSSFPTQLVWLAITFIALYVLMAKVALPRVGAIVAARQGRIEGDLAQAERMKAEAETVIAAYERALAEARQQAQQTLKEATDRLNAEAAEQQRRAVERIAAETGQAEKRIAEAKSAALRGVRQVALDVAMAAASKLTGSTIGSGRAAAAIDAAMRERG
ncbi:MAG TPA: F0F1 ATP synthase subunit B' [Stellaceae bacterium]|nr:F0F1 ATP synthase subunit B' [Stellaceae bacterium]